MTDSWAELAGLRAVRAARMLLHRLWLQISVSACHQREMAALVSRIIGLHFQSGNMSSILIYVSGSTQPACARQARMEEWKSLNEKLFHLNTLFHVDNVVLMHYYIVPPNFSQMNISVLFFFGINEELQLIHHYCCAGSSIRRINRLIN